MKDVSMMPTFIPSAHIGVHPDGSPVVYDPEKAAAKRAEIVAGIREKNGIPDDKFLTVSFTPELERGYVRSPEKDTVEIGNRAIDEFPSQDLCASIKPKDVIEWAGAIEVVGSLIAKYGPGIIDFLRDFLVSSKPVPTVEPPKDHSNQHTIIPEKKEVPDFAMVD